MKQHLLLISLGPIQDFIASARRCQDLWFGSWLLSDLARATAEDVEKHAPGNKVLIFPAGLDRADKPSVANKILAILPGDVVPASVAADAKIAMQKQLASVASVAFNGVTGTHFRRDLATAQLTDLMEFIWVAVPLADGEHAYAQARDQAEALLSARKNTRNWGPVPWHRLGGKGVPKSSLDGLRESVIDEAAYEELKNEPEKLRRQYAVKHGERLCGIGLLKRLGADPDFDKENKMFRNRKPVFHSTSHIASAPILTRIARVGAAGEAAFRRYLKELDELGVDTDRFRIATGEMKSARVGNPHAPEEPCAVVPRTFGNTDHGHLDGYLLFEGRLPELLTEYCQEASNTPDIDKLKKASQALAEFRRTLGLREGHTTYYAYLLADGDSMGKAIDALAQLPDGIEQHRKLSQALEGFSAKCQELVEKAGGSLVYAGGDDVLALCPLHTVLSLSRELRDSFSSHVAPAFSDVDKLRQLVPDFKVPTLSVGLGISHHMESMERARELAKQAEKAAKDNDRNSLAVVVAKRSGGTITVTRKWTDDDTSLDTWLVELSGWLSRGELPDGLAFELEQLLAPFAVEFGERPNQTKVGNAILALANGIVQRKRADGGKADLPERLNARLHAALLEQSPAKAVARLSEEIQVARLFKLAFDDAFGPLPKKGAQ